MKCPRGCGQDITWGQDATGRKLAFDKRASVWLVRTMAGDKVAMPVRDSNYRILHFPICSAPSNKPLALWKSAEASNNNS